MDIRFALAQDRSKRNIERVAAFIGTKQDRANSLLALVGSGIDPIPQRAAWVLSVVCEAHPENGAAWVPEFLGLLERSKNEGVHRNVLRSLQFIPLDSEYHGSVYDRMIRLIVDPNSAIASRVFAMTVAHRVVIHHEELASELIVVLEQALLKHPGPAVNSRANRILRHLRKGPGSESL